MGSTVDAGRSQTDMFGRLDTVVSDLQLPLSRGSLSEQRTSAMDAHARACPATATHTIAELAAYLSSAARNAEEKVRVICFWLHLNVRYDTEAYNSGNIRSMSAVDVLRDRCTVCHGFALLMEALCKACNVQCQVIDGYAKGSSYTRFISRGDKEMEFESNHNWNAVKLYVPSRRKERWHLVDPTWCAGHSNGMTWIQEWGREYYLADPMAFAQSHFPEKPAWTLLPEQYRPTWRAFTRAVRLRFPVCWDLHIFPVSHMYSVLEETASEGHLRIVFKVKKGAHMLAKVDGRETKVYPSTLPSPHGSDSDLLAFDIKDVQAHRTTSIGATAGSGCSTASINIFASAERYGTFAWVTEYIVRRSCE